MGHTFLEHGNGKHDKDAMAWGDWILATRSGGQSQGPRQNATVGSKLNPQGRAKSGRPLAKELQDDASSPHKVGDGKMYEDSGTGSTGAVLRSDRGVFIAGSCSAISFAEDVSSAEARALRDGLIMASEVGVQKIIVESDCQDVIDTMLLDGNSLGPAAAVYEECSFLAKNFVLIQFAFCPREANVVAHTLARFVEPTRTIKWMEEPPGFLIDTLANDVTAFSHEI
ncbi:hypothetical protein D1007_14715 [Hordeum vulgare]|nr:hypothetical protein D1007_14715 [Hordeum vulgare]